MKATEMVAAADGRYLIRARDGPRRLTLVQDGARLVAMVAGSVTSAAVPGAPAWDVVVGDRFIAALAAPAPDSCTTAFAAAASDEHVTIEALVGYVPTPPAGSVESFAIVWWPGVDPGDVTAVVRGDAVVDLTSPGGTRRFDARGIRPWHLAEFGDVVALRITAADAPLDRLGEAPDAVRHARASLRASSIEWAGSTSPRATAAAAVDADTILMHRPRSPSAEEDVPSPAPPAPWPAVAIDDADTILVSGRERARPPVIVPPAVAPPAVVAPSGEQPSEVAPRAPIRAAGVPPVDAALHGRPSPAVPAPPARTTDTTVVPQVVSPEPTPTAPIGAPVQTAPPVPSVPAPAPPVPSVPMTGTNVLAFRIGGGTPRPITGPVLIGRRPLAPRIPGIAGPTPELVTVASPGAVVSGTHLELRREGTRLVATDLRSTNGTVVRTQSGVRRMRAGESIVVAPGTSLDLGDDTIIEILLAPAAPAERSPTDSRPQP